MATSLQLAGLASGFDWKIFVDTVMQTERAPITRLQSEKTTNTSKVSVFDTLATKITDLQTSVKALSANGLFGGRSAKSTSTNSSWPVTASSSTATGNYTFAISQLATATKRAGAADLALGLAASSDVSGITLSTMPTATAVSAGYFTVNGSRVTLALSDSLQDVFDKISTATNGAVTASYDSGTDKITLSAGSPITIGASNDTSNFLAVAKLSNNNTGTIASSASLGSMNPSTALASARLRSAITAVDGSGNGSFTINGTSIAYNVNTDSFSAVLARINASDAGVTAAYDPVNDQLTLTNKTTGNVGLSFSESAGGFLSAAGINSGTTSLGLNAQYTINGGPTLTSASNTFDASSHGITGLSVTANSQTSETISVAADTSSMRKAIEDFIAKYNSVQTYIDDQTKITTGSAKVTTALMSNNREIQNWASTFRSKVFEQVSGLGGAISRLDHLGIDTVSGTSQLAIKNGTKLDAALRDKPNEVEAFFKTTTTGFAAKIDSFATTLLGTGTSSTGLINAQKNSLTTSNTGIDKQIADIERHLTSERSRLEAGFIAMEQVQSTMQQMQQQLTNALKSS